MKTFIIFMLGILIAINTVDACSCAAREVKDQLRYSAFVFVGKVIKIEAYKNSKHYKITTLKIQKAWKGIKNATDIQVVSHFMGEACGFPFSIGHSYLIYDDPPVGKVEISGEYPYVHLCSRSSRIDWAAEDLKLLGKPKLIIHRSEDTDD